MFAPNVLSLRPCVTFATRWSCTVKRPYHVRQPPGERTSLLTVRDCLFGIFAATIRSWGTSPPSSNWGHLIHFSCLSGNTEFLSPTKPIYIFLYGLWSTAYDTGYSDSTFRDAITLYCFNLEEGTKMFFQNFSTHTPSYGTVPEARKLQWKL